MSKRHRIKVADGEDNFLYINLRLPRHEVEAIIATINHRSNCAARYERALRDAVR